LKLRLTFNYKNQKDKEHHQDYRKAGLLKGKLSELFFEPKGMSQSPSSGSIPIFSGSQNQAIASVSTLQL
jgi:hypothetical protein